MCGLFSSIRIAKDSRSVCEKLLEHRGPDDSGFFELGDVTLMHRRLSILDLSSRGHQPMETNDGKYSIVFNGEIYNFPELRKDLESHGYTFKSGTDTEAIVAGFAHYGKDFFSRLRGMWAFVILDKHQQKLYISRDYHGIKPLYYFFDAVKNAFACASEIKSLISLLPTKTPSKLYPVAFNLGYFPAGHTSFEEIKSVLPGSVIEIDTKTLEHTQTQLPIIDQTQQKALPQDREAALIASLKESVGAHYMADVPVALLLSGGTDSSLIAALSHELGYDPRCFHVAIKDSSDTQYARAVAKYLGLKLEERPLTFENVDTHYKEILEYIDQPLSDIAIIPTYMVYASIRGEAKVVLSGEGGDELAGGYIRHKQFASAKNIINHDTLSSMLDTMPVGSVLTRRMRNALNTMRHDLIGLYITATRPADVGFGYDETRAFLAEFYNVHPLKDSVPAALFFDQMMYLPYMLMYKNDIASMANSIEARVPFVDRDVTRSFIQNIYPAEKHFDGSKKLLKKALEKYLPHDLVYRDKKGFGISLKDYGTDAIKDDLQQALDFHAKHHELFGMPKALCIKPLTWYIEKFPRLAFFMITNWRTWHGWAKLS